jgi:glycerophosphoryl diester phosphodiesterase
MTKNIAHRGARSVAPENTMAAVKKAFDFGADLLETDVSVTKDEQLILFHDNSLVRTTDVEERFPDRESYLFTEFTLDEILELSAGSYFEKTDPSGEIAAGNVSKEELAAYRDERVPTLEEGLVFTKENHWQVNLELKDLPGNFASFPLPRHTLDMIQRVGLKFDQFVISSFNHKWLEEIQAMEPRIEVQALLGRKPGDHLDFEDFRFPVYNPRHTEMDEAMFKTLKEKQKKINLFTVNEPEEMLRFLKAGVDGIITDFPQRLKAIQK